MSVPLGKRILPSLHREAAGGWPTVGQARVYTIKNITEKREI